MTEPTTALLRRVLQTHDIETGYPAEVRREVEVLLANPGIDDPSLDDLTHLPFVTIDHEDSLDLDQAVQIEKSPTGDGGFVVNYALADASHFVRPGSALFAEALKRGVSYYLPGMVVPMLPAELSEDIISLNPDVLRRALVFTMTLDGEGRCLKTELCRARIRSRAKLSFNGVQRYVDDPAQSPLAGHDFSATLDLLRPVGELRINEARQRDVVHFRRADILVELDEEESSTFRLMEDERNDVSLWNEQISLLCNIEGANFLARGAVPNPEVQPIYRVHGAPSPRSLDHLAEVIAGIATAHGLDPDLWHWKRGTPGSASLGDYLDRLPLGGATERVRQAIERHVLITNQRSVFSSEPGRHFALGVAPYSRFSSPMREVVGIFTHKEALEKLGLIEPAATPEEDEELRELVIAAANGAKERQRLINKDLLKLAVDELLRQDLDRPEAERPTYGGTVLGIRPTRLYVRLDEPPAELKVYLLHMEAQLGRRLEYRPEQHDVVPLGRPRTPRIKVGDEVRLRCRDYDRPRRKWNMGLVDWE